MSKAGSLIHTPEEYQRAVRKLEQRLAGDSRALALATELEKVLRYELEQQIPELHRCLTRLSTSTLPAARRTALISDIHGNHAGLLAVLEDIERQDCERIVCLGDLVDGGPDNEQVLETVQQRSILCVRGNHDDHHDLALSVEAVGFLMNLPEQRVDGDVLYVHISPRASPRKIDDKVEAWNVFEETAYRLIFIGHVHIPGIFGKQCALYGEAQRHPFQYNQPFKLAIDDRYIVCVGAIGYGRDEVGKLRYAIFDHEADTVELRAIDGPVLPFDYAFR